MYLLAIVLVVMSVWEYPSRQLQHERLRLQFSAAVGIRDAKMMENLSRQGVELLPDDPTWRYNLACSMAHFKDCEDKALDELEKAIDLGYRNDATIAKDPDFAELRDKRRFNELVEYAKEMQSRPIRFGPLAAVKATGDFGKTIMIGEHNLGWNYDFGCFVAKMELTAKTLDSNTGDLYMNRDRGHSVLDVTSFPGITVVRMDKAGCERDMDVNFPNALFPYPVFGNCSRAFTSGPCWRSLPRAIMTAEAWQMKRMMKLYLSNQTWVFPANADIAPIGTNGDVFASISPYWIATAGCSYSDLPYLQAALSASRAFPSATKKELVDRGLLAATIQTLIRKSLNGVNGEDGYLTERAHPTAFPAGGLDIVRMLSLAKAMKPETIPPLAPVVLRVEKPVAASAVPELTYASSFAWALVLRSDDVRRTFYVKASGADEYAFVQTHGAGVAVDIERIDKNSAKVTIDRRGMSPTNRVDITVVGRKNGTGWGAPSYISFARMDSSAPYSDPILTVSPRAKTK